MILLLVKHNAFSVGRHHHYCHCIALLREWKNKRDKEHTHTTLEERALAQTFLSVDIIISESALSWKPQCSNTQFRSTSIFFYFKTFKNFLPDINSPVNHYSHRHFHSAQNCKCFRVCVFVCICVPHSHQSTPLASVLATFRKIASDRITTTTLFIHTWRGWWCKQKRILDEVVNSQGRLYKENYSIASGFP